MSQSGKSERRTREWLPSHAMSRHPVADVPSSNVAVTDSGLDVIPFSALLH
jgi:hypothetical protein